jgi:mRNA interferase RelE/StbE
LYEVLIPRRVRRRLARLPESVYERVLAALKSLEEEPRPRGSLKMTNRDEWRVRVGDYRIVYNVDDEQRLVTILQVGHRRDIYR